MSIKAIGGIGGALIVVVIVGWIAFSAPSEMQSPALEGNNDGETMTQRADSPIGMVEVETVSMAAGTYEAYAPEKLAFAEKGDVVLFFRAAWCPTCRGLDADIRANAAKIPAGVAILDLNYDTATELKQKYGVTYQHTLVQVDAKGNQIAKWTGSPTLAALLSEGK